LARRRRRAAHRVGSSPHILRASKRSRQSRNRQALLPVATRRASDEPPKIALPGQQARQVGSRREPQPDESPRSPFAGTLPSPDWREKHANSVAGTQSRRLNRLLHVLNSENKEFSRARLAVRSVGMREQQRGARQPARGVHCCGVHCEMVKELIPEVPPRAWRRSWDW